MKRKQKPTSSQRRTRPLRWLYGLAVMLLLVAVGALLLSRRPNAIAESRPGEHGTPPRIANLPPLPEPTLSEDANGMKIARIDLQAVEAWCRTVGLPMPAAVELAEPAVVEALLAALQDAAANPGAPAYGRLGRICESLDGHRSAEAYFRLAEQADPRDHRWPYYLGCIAQVTGQTEAAVENFKRARERDPQYAVTYARLAQLYLELGRDDEAAAMSQRFIELRPRDWLGFVGLGRVALRREDYATALRHLQEAVERGPQDFQSHYYLAKAYAGLGQQDKAEEHFARSAKLPRGEWFHHRDPLDLELHHVIESSAALDDQLENLQSTEEWVKMAALTERILERRPNDLNAMCNLASFYRKLRRYDEAHRILDRACLLAPSEPLPYRRRAELLLAESRPADVLNSVAEARVRGPDDMATQSVEARALYMLGRFAEAEAAMKQAIASAPDNPGNLFVMAEIVRAAGRAPEAAAIYRSVLELRPNDEPARRRLAELGQASESSP